MPPDAEDFENITDEGFEQWFADDVEGTPEFEHLIEAGQDAGRLPLPGDATFKGVDPDLVEGFKALENLAETAGSFGPMTTGAMDKNDWSADFGRLSREQQINFFRGWNRDHPAVFAPVPVKGASASWLNFRGKPTGWLVAIPVVLLIAGTWVVLDGVLDSDEENPATTESADVEAAPAEEVQAEEQPEPEATETVEEPEAAPEPEATPEEEAAPEEEPAPAADENASDPAIKPGTYEISSRVTGTCGEYAVFLRMIMFLNGQMTVDQLYTAGGNAFQSAAGLWGPQFAVATVADSSFFETWLFIFTLSDILSIYNVYGTSSPVVTPGSEPDQATYADVASAEQLDEATNGVGSCSTQLVVDEVTHTPFPG